MMPSAKLIATRVGPRLAFGLEVSVVPVAVSVALSETSPSSFDPPSETSPSASAAPSTSSASAPSSLWLEALPGAAGVSVESLEQAVRPARTSAVTVLNMTRRPVIICALSFLSGLVFMWRPSSFGEEILVTLSV